MQGVFLPVRMTKDKPKSLCTGLFWAFWAMFGIWQASCACVRSIIELKSPGESREKSETRPRDESRDRTRWSGIHGWLYGLVRTSALGRVVDLSLNPEASKCRGEGEGRLPRAPAHAVGKYVIGFISILILSISYINTYFNKYLRKYYIILIF